MKAIRFKAKCPYEIGDKIQFEKGGETKRIEKNFVKSSKKCLTNSVQYAIISKLSDERSSGRATAA